MKNIFKVKAVYRIAWVIALVAVIGFTMAACGGDGGGGDGGDYCTLGHTWGALACSVCGFEYEIGDTGPGDGKIFHKADGGFTLYLDAVGTTKTAYYLEASANDVGPYNDLYDYYEGLPWSAAKVGVQLSGTFYTTLGRGPYNTALILAEDPTAPAALACTNYRGGGKDDWFLPTQNELQQLITNRSTAGVSLYMYYWSSYQPDHQAVRNNVSTNSTNTLGKDLEHNVRAVRAF